MATTAPKRRGRPPGKVGKRRGRPPGRVAQGVPAVGRAENPVLLTSELPKILTIKDFKEILDLCQAKGVERLHFGEVEIQFGKAISRAETPRPVSGATRADLPQVSLANEQSLADADDAQKMIDDPIGFEQDQIDGHLQNEGLNAAAEAQDRETE